MMIFFSKKKILIWSGKASQVKSRQNDEGVRIYRAMITILSFVLSGFSFNRVSKTVGKATAKWAVKDRNKDN